MKITTKSGSVYRIEGGRVWKNDNIAFTLVKEPYAIDFEDIEDVTSWDDIFAAPKRSIEVGRHLYVHGRDEWWVSTPITSIEEEQ